MKRVLTLTAALITGMVCISAAYEQPNNPDRYLSAGINFGVDRGDFSRRNTVAPNTLMADTRMDNGDYDGDTFGLDFRIPTSAWTTWTISYAHTNTTLQLQRDQNSFQLRDKASINSFNLGLRVYFHK